MPLGQALSLEARIAALEDREAIRDLIASYGPLADAGEAQRLAELWTPHGSYDVGGFARYEGREAIAELIEGEVHRGLIADGVAHMLTAPLIELAGDEATARNYSCVMQRSGEGWIAHRVSANLWRLQRGPEGWRVVERINRPFDGGQEARNVIGGSKA